VCFEEEEEEKKKKKRKNKRRKKNKAISKFSEKVNSVYKRLFK